MKLLHVVSGYSTETGHRSRLYRLGVLPVTQANLASYPQLDGKWVSGQTAAMLCGWLISRHLVVFDRICPRRFRGPTFWGHTELHQYLRDAHPQKGIAKQRKLKDKGSKAVVPC